ncbi:MAG: 16S rRNA processing protein RimM [Clostridia bacterium]|nr:16S rRNA processing protein RimM [Clostridia bacterium]
MEFVYVGKIIKPQGIKGEVKILPSIDIPAIFNGKHALYIDKKPSPHKTATFRLGYAYVLFEEIPDRNTAEKYRNRKVYITKEEFDKLAVDDFLISDLVGTQILDENGELVGQIMGVTDYGFDDILIIKEDEHLYEVPFKKAIFKVADRRIYAIRAEYDGAKVNQE